MIVTDKKYYMEPRLVQKLDLMCKRCTDPYKFDNVLIVDGDEGYGKTTIAVSCAYYAAWKMGKEFNVNHIYFDVMKLIETARKTKDQVFLWDEAALAGLASEWHNKAQKLFIKFLMVARKKRHFIIFCIPKFYKLNEYLIVDRSIALLHVYAKDELKLGRFVFFKKSSKEKLFEKWKRSRKKYYKVFYDFHGKFINALPKIIDEDAYDKMKDETIANIGEKDDLTWEHKKLIKLQYKIAMWKEIPDTTKEKAIGNTRDTIRSWRKHKKKYPDLFEMDKSSG